MKRRERERATSSITAGATVRMSKTDLQLPVCGEPSYDKIMSRLKQPIKWWLAFRTPLASDVCDQWWRQSYVSVRICCRRSWRGQGSHAYKSFAILHISLAYDTNLHCSPTENLKECLSLTRLWVKMSARFSMHQTLAGKPNLKIVWMLLFFKI